MNDFQNENPVAISSKNSFTSQPACLLVQASLARLSRPLIIGIAGDSGSGKTRLSQGIRQLLGVSLVQSIEMDGYHTQNRTERKISGKLPLDPSVNNLALVKQHLEALRKRETITVPIYNHQTGEFDTPISFAPTPIVILEGLHALYPELLPLLDFTIYVDASREIKWQWKKGRDMVDRGHDDSQLEQEMFKREAAYKRWIDFQKTDAMVVVKIYPSQLKRMARYQFMGSLSQECFKIELLMEPSSKPLPSLILPFDLGTILDVKTPPFMLASIPSKYWGRDVLNIHIDGELSPQTVKTLAEYLESCTGGNQSNTGQSIISLFGSRFLHAVYAIVINLAVFRTYQSKTFRNFFMKRQAILFDLDGTLLDTLPGLMQSMNEILEKYSFPTHSVEDYKKYIGNGIQALVEQSAPPNTPQELLAQMYKEKTNLYQKYWKDGTHLFPGIDRMLSKLHKYNIALAIFSNKEDFFTQQIVKKCLSSWHFVFVSGRTQTIPKKPNPKGLLKAFESQRFFKEEWLCVGDKDADIEAAREVGVDSAWVFWGYQNNPPQDATYVLHTPDDIFSCL